MKPTTIQLGQEKDFKSVISQVKLSNGESSLDHSRQDSWIE
jgi:hypothetical protein